MNLILFFIIYKDISDYKIKTIIKTILLKIYITLGKCLYYNSSIKKYKENND